MTRKRKLNERTRRKKNKKIRSIFVKKNYIAVRETEKGKTKRKKKTRRDESTLLNKPHSSQRKIRTEKENILKRVAKFIS